MSITTHYEPKIEEFYIGFEYEYLHKDNWIKHQIYCTQDIIDISFDLMSKTIRVKYLDASDIESFGFVETITEHGVLCYKKEHECRIIPDPTDTKDTHFFIENLLGFSEKSVQVFSGYIRNKSELKKVLQQIGVLKND